MTSVHAIGGVVASVKLTIDGPKWKAVMRSKRVAFVEIEGAWTHPSLNEWATGKVHYGAQAMLKAAWVAKVVETAEGLPRITGPVSVVVTTFFRRRARRDPDNYVPKFIMDGLKECVIDDDDAGTVVALTTRIAVDPEWPRTEIEIRPAMTVEEAERIMTGG